MSVPRSIVNRLVAPERVPAPAGAEITAFHAELRGYAASPLRDLPAEARALGIASLRYKDESDRFGLPAFKILGASWASRRAFLAIQRLVGGSRLSKMPHPPAFLRRAVESTRGGGLNAMLP